MRVTIAESTLLIRPSRLVVLGDDALSDVRARSAESYAVGSARKHGIEVRCGTLGHEALAEAPLNVPAGPGARGRFLTPVLESGLLDGAEGATLLLLVGGPVYDWDDRAAALLAVFSAVHIVRFAPFARVHAGATEHRAERLADPAIEGLIDAALTAGRTTRLAIEVHDGVLLGMPGVLAAEALGPASGVRGVRFNGVLPECSITAPVTPVPLDRAAEVRVTLTCDDRAEEVTVPAREPAMLHRAPLTPGDERLLDEALAAYGAGSAEHACPFCDGPHGFGRALVCEKGGGVFARRATRALSAWRDADTGRLLLVPGERWSAAGLADSSALWLGDIVLLRTADGSHVALEPHGDVWRRRALERVYPGLERDRVTGTLVVSADDGPVGR